MAGAFQKTKWSKRVIEIRKREDLFHHLKHFEKAAVLKMQRLAA